MLRVVCCLSSDGGRSFPRWLQFDEMLEHICRVPTVMSLQAQTQRLMTEDRVDEGPLGADAEPSR